MFNIYCPVDDGYFIPMSMSGTICGFTSRFPTHNELEECHMILLSDEKDWDPGGARFVFLL